MEGACRHAIVQEESDTTLLGHCRVPRGTIRTYICAMQAVYRQGRHPTIRRDRLRRPWGHRQGRAVLPGSHGGSLHRRRLRLRRAMKPSGEGVVLPCCIAIVAEEDAAAVLSA